MNLWVEFVLWSTYDPQNVTEVLNNFPKAAMEKALLPYGAGPITNLTLLNNSGNFEYNFIVPYVTNTSFCLYTKAGNETSGNVCAVVDYKYCDVGCYWAEGNNNSTRFRYTRNKLTATVVTTTYLFSPNAGSYVKDALKSAEQFTLMVETIGGYLALTITAISSNSCEQGAPLPNADRMSPSGATARQKMR
ncbi:hypothetical protein TELCIR_03099 [Teladorsagia circumcincta]|uniref:Uncharacterized protein n=1 Tax=Teladorsagia circumcincta TaxID=45464 RepID=A0A2G9UXM2_TELCI|nr:hypothetical protein TELCIR_03099 [Teladorsagia circumcincta]